jgi:outer membrane receptor for ferrienterochelin and colicin
MNFRSTFTLVCLIPVCSITISSAIAQDSIPANKQLADLLNIKVKVSSTIASEVFYTPSTVTVIDRQFIRKYNFLTVADALRTVAGINILYSNLEQTIPTARGILQNYYANKILLLINNVPTWQALYGNGDYDRISIDDVERIEVLKGPASVLYGSNAYTAVINIILGNESKHSLSSTLRTGFPGYGSVGTNVNFNIDKTTFFISANSLYEARKPFVVQSKSGEPFQGDSVYRISEEQRSRNFNLIVNHGKHSLLLNTFAYTYTFPGITPSYLSGGGNPFYNKGTLLNYRYQNEFSEKTGLQFNLGYDYYKRSYTDTYTNESRLEYSCDRWFASLKSSYILNDKISLEAGIDADKRYVYGHKQIDFLKDSVMRENIKNLKNIIEWSMFAQAQFNLADFGILMGTRYTVNANFGHNWSSRISMFYSFAEKTSVKLIWGQAFRTPSFLEVYFDHPTVAGNLNLKPETNESSEIAFLWGGENLFIQNTLFYSKFKNLIQRTTPVANKPSEYNNVGFFEGIGSEIELKYENPKLPAIFVAYTFTRGLGKEAKPNYNLVPSHMFSTGVSTNIKSISIAVNGFYMSSVKGLLKTIAAQYFIDLNLCWQHQLKNKLNLKHSFSVKNITRSEMLVPEYIRQTKNINELSAMGFGTRVLYSLAVKF